MKRKKWCKIKNLLAVILAVVLLVQVPLGYVVHAEDAVSEEGSGEMLQNPEELQKEPLEAPQEELQEELKEPEAPPQEEAVPETAEETKREAKDWSDAPESIRLSFEKITAGGMTYEKDETGEGFDLSSADPVKSLQFDLSVELLGVPEGEEVLPGDTAAVSLPEDQWKLKDVSEPSPFYICDREEYLSSGMDAPKGEEAGTYVIAGNELKITFSEAIQGIPSFFGVLSFEADLMEEAQGTESVLTLQPENQVKILLPKDPQNEEVKAEEQSPSAGLEEIRPEAGDRDHVTKKDETKEEVKEEIKKEEKEETSTEEKEPVLSEDKEKSEQVEESAEEAARPEEKTGIREKIGSLFQRAAAVFTKETKAVNQDYYKNAVKSKHIFSGSDLPDGFDIVKLTVLSKEGGYSKDEPEAYVNLAYSVYMDEDFLYTKSEEFMNITSFPQQGDLSDAEWLSKVKSWLDAQDDATVVPLVYTYDLGENFQGFSQEKKELYNAVNDTELIGEYEITDGVLKVTMNSLLYFMNDISFAFNFDARLDASGFDNGPQEIVVGDQGQLIHQSQGTAGGGGGETGTPDYTVTKEAPVKVSDTRITYHLSVSAANNKMLNGKILSDVMPKVTAGGKDYKLKVISIAKKDASGAYGKPITGAVNADGDIYYQFEKLNKNQTNAMTEAEFELVLELDDDSYQNMITEGSISLSFVNQASLLEEGTGSPAAVSESVPTKMEVSFIGKQGKEANLEGTRYAWTIDLKTKLPIMKPGYGFLVDTICQTDHTYDMAAGVEVNADGISTKVLHPELKTVTSPVKWEDLTAQNIHDMMAADGITGAFYYVYDVEDENGNKIPNPFYGRGNDTSEYVQRAVMVLPYDDYKGPNADGSSRAVTIKYLTDLNRHGLDSKTYLDLLSANPSYTQEIENKVNLLWLNEGGKGPGPVPQDQVDFGKRVDTDIDAVNKKGAGYDPVSKTAEWAVDVNKLGLSLKKAVLTDELGTGIYDVGNIKITYYKYYSDNHASDETGELKELAKAPAEDELGSAFGYTLDASSGQLKIYLGDLDGDSTSGYIFYKLSIKLPVIDEGILSNQSDKQSKTNEISLEAVHAGTPYKDQSSADLVMPNTLIEKSAEGTYNYQTHELSWSVTVNPQKVNIMDARVTDTIETGFDFGTLTKVAVDNKEDAAMLAQLKSSQTVSGQTVEWNLGDIGEHTYQMYFTTEASKAWRDQNLICPTDGSGELITDAAAEVPNNVELTGKVNGTKAITEAKAQAAQSIPKMPVEKKGTLVKDDDGQETGEIRWVITINKDQYNLSGMYLTESLTSVHELDPDSARVYVVEADGKETEETGGTFKDVSADGFTYVFPENGGENYQSYKVTFSTYLTEEAEASDAAISNQVYLKNKDGNYEEISKPDDGGFHGGFDFDNAAKASKRPKIALRKVSSNSTDPSGGDNQSLGLNAVFSLKGYEYSYDNSTKTLTIRTDAPVSKYDKTRTVAAGDASFLNINPSDDILYVLTEDQALGGYNEMTAEPQFLHFPRSLSTGINGDVEKIVYDGNNYTAGYSRFNPEDYNNGQAPAAVTVTNTPKDSVFEFSKYQVKQENYMQDGSAQNKEYEPSQNVIFKVEPRGDLKDKVKTRYVKSDASGKLKLENLDPGEYLLTEISSDANIVSGGSVTLLAKWEEASQKYTYTFGSPSGGISIDPADAARLNDELMTGGFSFTKYIQYQDHVKGANAAKEALSGVKFTLKGKTNGSSVSDNFSQEVVSDGGKVQFQNLPVGSYKVYEEPVKGYEEYLETAPVLVYTVEVAEKSTSEKLGSYEGTDYYAKKAEVSVKPERNGADDTDTEAEIHNTPVRGTISLTKSLAEDVLKDLNQKKIQGAEFGLYRLIGSQAETDPLKTAVTNEQGQLEFTDVEYGDYILKETKVPDGYDGSSPFSAEIRRGSLVLNADASSFTCELGSDQVTNRLYKTSIPFIKTDIDHRPLTGIRFTLYRKNPAAIGKDGAGLELDTDPAETQFWKYEPNPEAVTDGDGTFSLKGLPCGDYLMIEQNVPGDVQDGHSNEAIHIHITETELIITENEDFRQDVSVNPVIADQPADYLNWMEVKKSGNNYEIVNQKKFGFIRLYKTAGERKDGQITSDSAERISGAEFEITKDGAHYLTLKTNENGEIVPAEKDGMTDGYQDLAAGGEYLHLYYGTYTIKETKAPSGYYLNSTPVEFTIGDDTTGHEGSAWIALNGSDSQVSYTKAGDRKPVPETAAVVNERQRGIVALKKTDRNGNSLSGAVFGIYSGDVLIGTIKENSGTYHVVNEDADGSKLDIKNDSGVSYLYFNGAEYAILPGVYQVKELLAPAGYEVSDFEMEVSAEGQQTKISVTGNSEVSVQADQSIVMKDEPVELTIQKTDQNGSVLAGAQFTITGTFADGFTGTKTYAEAGSGQLTAGSTYILKETKAPDGYIQSKEEISFKVEKDGTFTIADGKNTASVDAGQKDLIRFMDKEINITLQKIDGYDKTTVIGGVEFTLNDLTDGTDAGTFTTEADGTVKLTGLIGGHSYELREISAPDKYVAGQKIRFTVKTDGTLSDISGSASADKKNTTLIVENKRVNASVRLKKIDAADGSGIGNTAFKLTKQGETAGTEYVTLSEPEETEHVNAGQQTEKISLQKGELFITGLEKGSYRLQEISADSSYLIDTDPFECTFTVSDDCGSGAILEINSGSVNSSPFQLNLVKGQWNEQGILNERKTGTVTLTKQGKPDGGDTLIPLPGAEFTLYHADTEEEVKRADGTVVKEVTGPDGHLEISGLLWGSYYLKETKAPDGYAAGDEKLEFTIGYGALTKGFSQQAGGSDIVNKATVFTLRKTDLSDRELTGAIFTLTGKFADSVKGEAEVRTYSMKDIGNLTVYRELIAGEIYQLKETAAPEGYKLAADRTITVSGNGKISVNGVEAAGNEIVVQDEEIKTGLRKTDMKGTALTGGRYTVAPAAGSRFAGTDQTAVEVTEASMETVLSGRLTAGNEYVLTEIQAPEGYETADPVTFKVDENGKASLPGDPESAAVDSAKEVPVIVLKDRPIELKLVKYDENQKELDGAVFTVEGVFAGEDSAPQAVKVSPAESEKLSARLIAGNTYTITETTAPDGYVRMSGRVQIQIQADGTAMITEDLGHAASLSPDKEELRIVDKPTKFYLDKVSDEPDEQGNTVRVKGAVLEIRQKDGSPIDGRKWTSDGIEKCEITKLKKGEYQLVETSTPFGYVTAEPVFFTLHDNNEITLNGTEGRLEKDADGNYTIVMTDIVLYAHVELKKERTALDGKESTPLPDAVFQLYRQSGNQPDMEKDILIADNLVTDADGMWTTKGNQTVRVDNPKETLEGGLTEGTYYFREIKAPVDTWLDGQNNLWIFHVKSGDYDSTVKVSAENKAFQAKAVLTKADQTSQEALSGVEFTLQKKNDSGQWVKKSAKETQENGKVSFDLYEKGNYRITETKTIQGYVLKEDEAYTAEFTVDDAAYRKTLHLAENISESEQNIFHPKTEHAVYVNGMIANERIPGTLRLQKADQDDGTPIDGVTFSLYKKGAGSKYEKAGEFLTGSRYMKEADGSFRQESAETGTLSVEGLDWGEYYIQESEAQTGYVLSDAKYEFSIGKIEQEVILEVNQGTIQNARTRMYLYKAGRVMEDCADGTLEGVPDADTTVRLAGCEFTAYTDKACEHPALTAVTGSDGMAEFTGLSGNQTYYIKETKAPEGYLLNENTYQASLDERGQYKGLKLLDGSDVQDLTVVNDVRRTDLTFRKVSEQDPALGIAGSVYGLYKRTARIPQTVIRSRAAAAPKEDAEEWTLIATTVSEEDGRISFKGVLMDTEYMIRELKAPDGSHVSEYPITMKFGVNENGEITITEMSDGSGTVEVDPETGEILWKEPSILLEFAKKDTEGRLLSGAELKLVDEDGKTVDQWTSSSEKTHMIYGDKMKGRIAAGRTYELVEEKAPKGYLKAEPVAFTVKTKPTGPKEGFIQKIEMIDEKEQASLEEPGGGGSLGGGTKNPPENPKGTMPDAKTAPKARESAKTGDSDNALPYIIVMAGAALAAGILSVRKKRKIKE